MTPISNFLDLLRVEFYGCPDPLLEQVVVESIRQFCQDSWFLEKTLTQNIQQDDIDSDEMYSVVVPIGSLLGSKGVFLGIKKLLLDSIPYDAEERNITEPSTYVVSLGKLFYTRQSSSLILYPVKSPCELDLTIATSYTKDVSEVDDILFLNCVDTIRDHARMYLYGMPNQPWSDPNKVPWYRNEYRRGINRAKIARHKDNTGKDTKVSSRSYVSWLV